MTQTNSTQIFTSETAMAAFARGFAAQLAVPQIIALHGDLGAGKSTFARAVIRALAGDADLPVPSPTFTLMQAYESPRGTIYHYDFYRLHNPDDVYELGWDDAQSGIVLIEWPERLAQLLPARRLDLYFDYGADVDTRSLLIKAAS